jgi:hypothetical protein
MERKDEPMKYWRWWTMLMLLFLGMAFVPLEAVAQDGSGSSGGVIFRVNGPAQVGRGETVDNVLVINGNATVNGSVRQSVAVVNGNTEVSGLVDGDLNVVNGRLTLKPDAWVHNVMLFNSTLDQAPGSSITGSIQRHSRDVSGWPVNDFFSVGGWSWFWTTILAALAGLLFAGLAGHQLVNAGRLILERTGGTIGAALIVVIGLPILALLLAITIIGIPVAIVLLLFIPVIAFLGYLVVATLLGLTLAEMVGRPVEMDRPYIAALGGVLVLRLLELIPVLGGLVAFLASLIGTGALAYALWQAWRSRAPSAGPPARGPAPA